MFVKAEEFKQRMVDWGFYIPIEDLVEGATKAGVIESCPEDVTAQRLSLEGKKMLKKYTTVFRGVSEPEPMTDKYREGINHLITSSFRRSGEEEPCEPKFFRHCMIILFLVFDEFSEESGNDFVSEIHELALQHENEIVAAHVFFSLAVYIKDLGLELGIIKQNPGPVQFQLVSRKAT